MARSKKDGKRGGGHKPAHGSRLMMDGKCGVNGKPTGVKEPFGPTAKRFYKRLTSKSRRRKSKEVLETELYYESRQQTSNDVGHTDRTAYVFK